MLCLRGDRARPDLVYAQLVESYRLIFESANAFTYESATPARPPPPAETLERMLQAATYGAQVLDAAAKRFTPEQQPRPPTAADRAPEEDDGEAGRTRQVRFTSARVQDGTGMAR